MVVDLDVLDEAAWVVVSSGSLIGLESVVSDCVGIISLLDFDLPLFAALISCSECGRKEGGTIDLHEGVDVIEIL